MTPELRSGVPTASANYALPIDLPDGRSSHFPGKARWCGSTDSTAEKANLASDLLTMVQQSPGAGSMNAMEQQSNVVEILYFLSSASNIQRLVWRLDM